VNKTALTEAREAIMYERFTRNWTIAQWRREYGENWPKAVADVRIKADRAADDLYDLAKAGGD
jgi:hypothetical protein